MANLRSSRSAMMWIGVLGMLLACGCGDDGLPQRYRVQGEVTYNGKPVAQGTVNFIPQGGDVRAASGSINEGTYNLTTLTPGDGAMPGTYRVTVTGMEASDESKKITSRPPGAPANRKTEPYFGRPSGAQIVQASKVAKRLVPGKYGIPETSGLTAEVKAQSNTLNFPLTD
jgi:hypothetical protein